MPLNPHRRTVLAAGAAALLAAGCTGRSGAQPPATPPPSPEDQVRNRAARQSAALLARYDATTEAHPALARPLHPLRAAVAVHLAEFGGEGERAPEGEGAAGQGTAAAARSGESAPGAGRPEVPAGQRAAVEALVAAERKTTDARTEALDTAPPELARVLASAAAAGAVHGYLLTELLAEVS